MKLSTLIVAAALAIPAVSSFAQSNQSLTRAQVKSELVQLEKAGYNPASDRSTYPVEIQAAEAKVAAQNDQSSYGGVGDTTSASGHRAPANTGTAGGVAPVYFGH